tara:strand:+ start:174 stop:386 length:213 start_codon:yes stop_codon:yes gene_type:complete
MMFGKVIYWLLFWPGHLILFFHYFFPNEWGKKRNVSKFGRQYKSKHRKFFAVLYTIGIWALLYFVVVGAA